MAADTLVKSDTRAAFPSAAVEAKLRSAFLSSVQGAAARNGQNLPSSVEAQYAAYVHLDSLGVVDMLCDVEGTLGFQLKESIVKSGGYFSVNEAINHIMPRIESAWQKRGVKK